MKKVEDIDQYDLNDVIYIKPIKISNDWNRYLIGEKIQVYRTLIKCGYGYDFYTTQKGTEKIIKILNENNYPTRGALGYYFNPADVFIINRETKLKRILK